MAAEVGAQVASGRSAYEAGVGTRQARERAETRLRVHTEAVRRTQRRESRSAVLGPVRGPFICPLEGSARRGTTSARGADVGRPGTRAPLLVPCALPQQARGSTPRLGRRETRSACREETKPRAASSDSRK
jgi:hypothetical protein